MSSPATKWKFHLRHMLEAVERIRLYTDGKTEAELRAAPMVLDAVVWNLMVLGDAARHVPESVVAAFPEVPWGQMRGIRNHIVHGYDRIDFDIVWAVIQSELPPLVAQLERVMRKAEE